MIGKAVSEASEYLRAMRGLNPQKEVFMSLEQNVERIANALEALVALATASEAPEKKKKVKEPAPQAGIEDMLGDGVIKLEEKVTLDQLKDVLRSHMAKNGTEKTKALMIKHGAAVAKPVISSIPEANYAALLKEASA